MKIIYKVIILLVIIVIFLLTLAFHSKNRQEAASMNSHKSKNTKVIRLIFAGDLMFDRYIREVVQKKGYGYILQEIKPFLKNRDMVAVNLEGPITTFPSDSIGTVVGDPGHYTFTSDPSTAEALFDANIKLVNLANNHILNFGNAGLEQTQKYLENKGIEYFGTIGKPYTVVNFETYKIGFVGYNQFDPKSRGLAFESIEKIKDQVDQIILYTHWGNEYEKTANTSIQNLAHQFLDAGADLIIGSHPHVVQQKEIYNGKTIYYSLGNFVMDQYFKKEVKNGLIVVETINTDTGAISFEEVQTFMPGNGQTLISNE